MATVKETIAKIEAHEKECAIRYANIEQRLADGSKRFDKLETMLWAVYPFKGEGERRTIASNLNCWDIIDENTNDEVN